MAFTNKSQHQVPRAVRSVPKPMPMHSLGAGAGPLHNITGFHKSRGGFRNTLRPGRFR